MNDLVEITGSLEEKVHKLLKKYENLKQVNQQLEERLQKQNTENLSLEEKITTLENQNQTLRSANAMLGSKAYKRETKLKINSLIREIDQCIVQLSE